MESGFARWAQSLSRACPEFLGSLGPDTPMPKPMLEPMPKPKPKLQQCPLALGSGDAPGRVDFGVSGSLPRLTSLTDGGCTVCMQRAYDKLWLLLRSCH